jgi:hypothetical protein
VKTPSHTALSWAPSLLTAAMAALSSQAPARRTRKLTAWYGSALLGDQSGWLVPS